MLKEQLKMIIAKIVSAIKSVYYFMQCKIVEPTLTFVSFLRLSKLLNQNLHRICDDISKLFTDNRIAKETGERGVTNADRQKSIWNILEIIENCLRSKFHEYYNEEPAMLYKQLQKETDRIRKAFSKKIIKENELNILLPAENIGKVDSKKFDIPLLCFLLRNVCTSSKKKNSKKSKLSITAKTIKTARNEIIHTATEAYNNTYYQDRLSQLRQISQDAGCNKELIDVHDLTIPFIYRMQINLYFQTVSFFTSLYTHFSWGRLSSDFVQTSSSYFPREKVIKEIQTQFDSSPDIGLVITGPAGIGKSEITADFVTNLKINNKTIIWMKADSKKDLENSFESHMKLWCLNLKFRHLKRQNKKKWLSKVISTFYEYVSNTAHNCILVFDEVQNAEMILEFLPKVTPSNLKILITSRFSKWDKSTFCVYSMFPFTEEEATNYLHQKVNWKERKCEKDILKVLAKELDYLPLALSCAAIFLNDQHDWTLETFMEQLQRNPKFLFEEYSEGISTYKQTLVTACTVDLQHLHKYSHDLWNIILSFKKIRISKTDIKNKIFNNNATKNLVTYFNNSTNFEKCLNDLKNYSLLDESKDGNEIELMSLFFKTMKFQDVNTV